MTEVGRIESHIATKSGPLAELAARQHGVVAIWQLLELGYRPGAVKYQLGAGRLHQLHRGVYAVGHTALSLRAHLIAAVFAAGPWAVLSHRSAALLWGLLSDSRAVINVTTPDRGRASRGRVKVHRVRRLHPDDCAVVDGISVTSIARTLIDLAATATPRDLRYALDQAERLRLFDLRALRRVIARCRGRKGVKALTAALVEMREPANTNPGIERVFLELCDQAGIPRPQTNVFVAGYNVDAVWPEQRLVVELDSRSHHMTAGAFEEDRVRDATLQLAGYRVIRISWRRLVQEPDAVIALLRGLLGLGQRG
jgi:predicted transcriptional regulator of viral defense system